MDSVQLKEIVSETEEFESLTEKEMTSMLNLQEQQLREEEIARWIEQQKKSLRNNRESRTIEDSHTWGPRIQEKGSFTFSKRTIGQVLDPKQVSLSSAVF